MKARWRAAGLVFVLVAPAVPATALPAGEAPAPKQAATPQGPRPRLSLGPWGAHYSDGPPGAAILPDSPRFRDHVDVRSTPRDVNTTMQSWWDRFAFEYAVYGRGMNVQNPTHPGAFDLLRFSWKGKKGGDRTANPPLPLPPGPQEN